MEKLYRQYILDKLDASHFDSLNEKAIFSPEKIDKFAVGYLIKNRENYNEDQKQAIIDIIEKIIKSESKNITNECLIILCFEIFPVIKIDCISEQLLQTVLDLENKVSVVNYFSFIQELLPVWLKDKSNSTKVTAIYKKAIGQIKKEDLRDSFYPVLLKRIFKNKQTDLAKCCGLEIITILKEKIEELMPQDEFYSRASIEDSSQNYDSLYDPLSVLTDSLRDVFLEYALIEDSSNILDAFFASNCWIIKKIACHIVKENFEKYRSKFFNTTLLKEVLNNYEYNYEIVKILQKYFQLFSEQEKNKILQAVKNLEDESSQFTWWCVLKEQSEIAKDNCDNLIKNHQYVCSEHPEFPTYTTIFWGNEDAMTWLKLKESVNNDLTKVFDQLLPVSTVDKLCEVRDIMVDAVKNNLSFILNEINEFQNLDLAYKSEILSALTTLEEKNIDLEKILNFAKKAINKSSVPQYLKEDLRNLENSKPMNLWINVASFIHEKAKMFDLNLLNFSLELLEYMLSKIPCFSEGTEREPLNSAINQPKGKILQAWSQTVRFKHQKIDSKINSQEKKNFVQQIQSILDRELEVEGNYEFYAVMGTFFSFFFYIDQQWMQKNFDRFFPKDPKDKNRWLAIMDGYRYNTTVYSEIYKALKNNGDIDRTIKNCDNFRIRRKIINDVSIAYLEGQENIDTDDSSFKMILDQWDEKNICGIISLFYNQRESQSYEAYRPRIIDFWRKCHEKIGDQKQDNRKILSCLNMLLCFIDNIKENQNFIINSAVYSQGIDDSFFWDFAKKSIEESPTTKIIIDVLKERTKIEQESYDIFTATSEETIKQVILKLYDKKLQKDANEICELLNQRGYPKFREIYNQHNKES